MTCISSTLCSRSSSARSPFLAECDGQAPSARRQLSFFFLTCFVLSPPCCHEKNKPVVLRKDPQSKILSSHGSVSPSVENLKKKTKKRLDLNECGGKLEGDAEV